MGQCVVLAFVLLCAVGASLGVRPAPLPIKMLWRLTLIEHHPAVEEGAADVAFGNYYFDWSGPLVATRQENAISFVPWRPDVPFNMFWGNKGVLSAAYVDTNSTERMICKKLDLVYDSSFWPHSFLESNCTAFTNKAIPMPERFGGRFYDGRPAVPLNCTIADETDSMRITPTIWLDEEKGDVLRFDVVDATPGWNPQTWDILEQQALPDLPAEFMSMPPWCT